MKNIVIVGFMGTGKTVVAKLLAEKTGMKYVSTDKMIESREKKTIKTIFKEKGEEYFRKIEKEIVKNVSSGSGQIIDAGGGVVLDGENMKNLKFSGIVVCLWADPGVIHKRTAKYRTRPLLNVPDPEGRIKELMDLRRPLYEQADFQVDTSTLDAAGVAEQIMKVADEKDK